MMGLLNQLGRGITYFMEIVGGSPPKAYQTAVASMSSLRSLVERCDKCEGTGLAIRKRTPTALCPAGCVDGWQPSPELVSTVDVGCGCGGTDPQCFSREIALAVLRLLNKEDRCSESR